MSAENPGAGHWADLPPDLLGDISGRLNNVADLVRFHAVCRPWRDLRLHSPDVGRTFPPWLLGSCKGLTLHSVVNFNFDGGVISRNRRDCDDIILTSPPGAPPSAHDTNWVASEDGTAARLFTWSPEPRLVDILTGAVTLLPLFPCDDEIRRFMENPHGVVYKDGTIFLYSFVPEVVGGCIRSPIFTAAILRPGDAAWRSGTKRLDVPKSRKDPSVAYHDGKVVLYSGVTLWCVLTVDDLGGEKLMPCWNANNQMGYIRHGIYVFESGGELMSASILVQSGWYGKPEDPPPGALLVSVHALEEDEMWWVARDGRHCLGDRVLFLGSPASFAMDAAQLGMAGGCAYFIYGPRVFRYNFVDNEAQLVERLRLGWGVNQPFMWLRPQPAIAPIQKIRERLDKASNKN